jgi:hypothetical protein
MALRNGAWPGGSYWALRVHLLLQSGPLKQGARPSEQGTRPCGKSSPTNCSSSIWFILLGVMWYGVAVVWCGN